MRFIVVEDLVFDDDDETFIVAKGTKATLLKEFVSRSAVLVEFDGIGVQAILHVEDVEVYMEED